MSDERRPRKQLWVTCRCGNPIEGSNPFHCRECELDARDEHQDLEDR